MESIERIWLLTEFYTVVIEQNGSKNAQHKILMAEINRQETLFDILSQTY